MGEDIVPTLISGYSKQMGSTQDKINVMVPENRSDKAKVYDWHRCDTRMTELGDICNTMSASWGAGGNNMPYVLNDQGGSQMDVSKDRTATLRAQEHGHQPVVFEPGAASRVGNHIYDEGVTGTLRSNAGDNQQAVACNNAIVRRLTPLEAERLQGYPDHWTDIGEWVDSKGKTHKDADSPRYKALGNSIALPFWEWMAKRMVEKLKAEGVEEPTMASLFDGIGGFPLVYQRAGCKPVWASEVESFCIAVTKRRFPDGEMATSPDFGIQRPI